MDAQAKRLKAERLKIDPLSPEWEEERRSIKAAQLGLIQGRYKQIEPLRRAATIERKRCLAICQRYAPGSLTVQRIMKEIQGEVQQ